jgi:hypothetical protein
MLFGNFPHTYAVLGIVLRTVVADEFGMGSFTLDQEQRNKGDEAIESHGQVGGFVTRLVGFSKSGWCR